MKRTHYILPTLLFIINTPTIGIIWKKPLDLLNPSRLDLIPKYVYAKYRQLGIKSTWGKELYRACLQVMNNFHEGEPPKNCFDDYCTYFDATLDSIEKQGFNTDISLVPVNVKDGIIRNGAHRVTACLLHGYDVGCIQSHKGPSFHYTDSFLKSCEVHVKDGLQTKYLDNIALHYALLKKNTYMVNLFPSAMGQDKKVESLLKKYGTIVYSKKIPLTKRGAVNFIKCIYHDESWIGGWHNKFKSAHEKAAGCFPHNKLKSNPMRVFLFECSSLEKVKSCKAEIRKLFRLGNASVHINDTHPETVRIAKAVFNENSIHFLNHAEEKQCKKFERYIKTYKQWMSNNNVDPECFCIDGSAILSAYGLRDCNDLDYLHHGYENILHIAPDIDSHNGEMHHHILNKDEIIFNPHYHFYYNGIKFASLDVIRVMKEKRAEKKDFQDVALINTVYNQ